MAAMEEDARLRQHLPFHLPYDMECQWWVRPLQHAHRVNDLHLRPVGWIR